MRHVTLRSAFQARRGDRGEQARSLTLFEAVTVSSDIDRRRVVQQPVQNGRRYRLVAEDRPPVSHIARVTIDSELMAALLRTNSEEFLPDGRIHPPVLVSGKLWTVVQATDTEVVAVLVWETDMLWSPNAPKRIVSLETWREEVNAGERRTTDYTGLKVEANNRIYVIGAESCRFVCPTTQREASVPAPSLPALVVRGRALSLLEVLVERANRRSGGQYTLQSYLEEILEQRAAQADIEEEVMV